MKTNYFPSVVGNKSAINKLSFFLDSYSQSGLFPNCLFISPRGTGKSMLCEATGRALHHISSQKKVNKPLVIINCSSLKNIETLFTQLLLPYVMEKQSITFFFDETSALKSEIMDYFLTILNPNRKQKNKIRFGDQEVIIDFRKITFLFATTRPNFLTVDFRNRLEEIQLESYKNEEVAQILHNSLENKVNIDDKTLLSLASFTKSNPRTAIGLGNHVIKYCGIHKTKKFANKDVAPFTEILGLFPLGLTKLECEVLAVINKQEAISLTGLCAKFGMAKSAIQDVENNLLRFNLFTIEGKRKITPAGRNYLHDIEARLNS